VLDRGDAADLLDVLRHELGLSKSEKRFPRKDTCLAIYSHRVNTQGALATRCETVFPGARMGRRAHALFSSSRKKADNQALDYDDLLLYWRAMMEDEALAAEIGALFDHVLVDEYQDTNVLQAEILRACARRPRPHRGRRRRAGDLLLPRRDGGEHPRLPGASAPRGRLEDNYRSTQPILDAANALIGKSLVSRKGAGAKPRYVTVADDAAQATYVVSNVLETASSRSRLRSRRCSSAARTTATCSSSSSCGGTFPT
jgi:DNA helicase-2/ATP-dependent DNA helicase PcrA